MACGIILSYTRVRREDLCIGYLPPWSVNLEWRRRRRWRVKERHWCVVWRSSEECCRLSSSPGKAVFNNWKIKLHTSMDRKSSSLMASPSSGARPDCPQQLLLSSVYYKRLWSFLGSSSSLRSTIVCWRYGRSTLCHWTPLVPSYRRSLNHKATRTLSAYEKSHNVQVKLTVSDAC